MKIDYAKSGQRLAICTAIVCGAAFLAPTDIHAQVLQSAPAQGSITGQRIAIVIGNQDYENVEDLGNARKDAQDMARMLREFRFKVYDGYDLEKREFEELLRTAMLNIPEGADVVFFYAGHGIQIGRRNYLLPVDAKFESIYDVPLETMTLDRVIDTLAARGSAHVAILDSCRDNPFQDIRLAADLDANLFETRAGFDVFRTPLNSLVAYSTSPGAVASDGELGGNSPYTAAVLAAAREAPSENIQQLFPQIRERVHSATNGAQVPWESSTLVRPFYLTQLVTEEPESTTEIATQTETEAVDTTPQSVAIVRQFDRQVPLQQAIEAEIGQSVRGLELIDAPQKGLVALAGEATESVVFSPEIADVRALDLKDMTVTDSFTVEVATEGQPPRRIDVTVELNMDACDLAAGDALDLDGVGVYRLPNELDIREGLAACGASVERDPENARFLYQLGRVQQSAGRFEEAYRNIAAAADAGHTRAKYALSVLLSTERLNRELFDIPLDKARARELLEEGVAGQDPYAMHKLGKELLRESDSDVERKRGFELLERAVELGHTFSMNELGLYFLQKDSDHYIPERGMRYLRASELRQDIYGYNNLGFVALLGLDGNEANSETALNFFSAASEGGHPTAPANIARMILRDQLPGRSAKEALDWYDQSLERGDAWSGNNGATLILNGRISGMKPEDAAVRAAKAVHLAGDEPTAKAREKLSDLPEPILDRALQMVLQEVGQNVSVDGQVGPATLRALDDASSANGVPVPFSVSSDPLERLLLATKIYWAQNPVRFDLF